MFGRIFHNNFKLRNKTTNKFSILLISNFLYGRNLLSLILLQNWHKISCVIASALIPSPRETLLRAAAGSPSTCKVKSRRRGTKRLKHSGWKTLDNISSTIHPVVILLWRCPSTSSSISCLPLSGRRRTQSVPPRSSIAIFAPILTPLHSSEHSAARNPRKVHAFWPRFAAVLPL